MAKIKVLHVTGAMNRGGAEMMIMDIYKNISSDFHFDFLVNYNLITGIPVGDFDEEIYVMDGKIKHIGAQWEIGPIKYISDFKKKIKELGTPDIIHIHMNSKSGIIALAAKLAGIKKIITHCHGDLVFEGSLLKQIPGILELTFQKVLINKFATNYWGCSTSAVESLYYNRTIINKGALIINNAINVDNYVNLEVADSAVIKKAMNISEDTIVVGAVGRIVRRKNLSFIIDILNELQLKNINFIFVNVGKTMDVSYMSEVEQKIRDYNLEDKVMNLGLREDIPQLMNIFNVFVSPAHNEAFGIVAAEAQAAGLPTILSTEFPTEIDLQLGLVNFIEKFDAKIWADKILEVKNNRLKNDRLIKTTFQRLGFDIKENVKNIEKLYRK